MDRKILEDALLGIEAGTKLRLTFQAGKGRKGVLDDNTKAVVCYFVMMKDKNIIFPKEVDWAVMYAVALSGYWSLDSNRVVEVVVPEGFDQEWFVERLSIGLERIEILN